MVFVFGECSQLLAVSLQEVDVKGALGNDNRGVDSSLGRKEPCLGSRAVRYDSRRVLM